jgi:periplasmic copper chaperone A
MKYVLSALAAGLAFTLAATFANAHEFKLGDLEIIHPNSTEMVEGQPVGDGFFTVINHGKVDDRLLSVTSPVSSEVMLHEMKMEGQVMKMNTLPDGIAIPAGTELSLAKGGYHVMFMNPNPPFRQGDMVKATLTFEKAGKVDVEFMIEGRDTAGKPAGHDHSKMK